MLLIRPSLLAGSCGVALTCNEASRSAEPRCSLNIEHLECTHIVEHFAMPGHADRTQVERFESRPTSAVASELHGSISHRIPLFWRRPSVFRRSGTATGGLAGRAGRLGR
jgi:hypothetical protein